jgi:adenosylcobinamide kinase / adenosylcobinamide-phosphate guanylyltransferase
VKQLVLGGARSGKSRYAEQWVLAQASSAGQRPRLLVTADSDALDAEMQARVARHRNDRDANWRCVEEPLHLSRQLEERHTNGAPILIDCLSLWLSNCLMAGLWPREREAFLHALRQLTGDITLVSNEVGLGVVPMGEITRRFVDESGFLHQALAQLCDRVVFCAAGLPLVMKDSR